MVQFINQHLNTALMKSIHLRLMYRVKYTLLSQISFFLYPSYHFMYLLIYRKYSSVVLTAF